MNAAEEWAALVAVAVLGTDRRPLPEPPSELAPWSAAPDPAVGLLDRAAALVTARRAGARPLPAVARLRPPPPDARPPCPPAAAGVLGVLVQRGEWGLVREWLARSHQAGWRLPPEHAPVLLWRAAGDPELDTAVRTAAGPLAPWLDDVFAADRPAAGRSPAAPAPPAAPLVLVGDDPVRAVVEVFLAGRAGAQRAALRATVLVLDPSHLDALAGALDALAGPALTAALRRELADLARLRGQLVSVFDEPI